LRDPEEVPAVRHLAGEFLRAVAARGRVLLTPAGGLEVPVKVMIRRALPELAVEYLGAGVVPGPDDLLLALRPIHLYAGGAPGRPTRVSPGEEPGRLRVVQVFKALQAIEGRRLRKSFPAYVAFDTETTGLDVNRCEVIELAGARVRDGRVVETFHALIRPEGPVPPGATAIHGYTDADLADEPSLAEVWPRFRAFVGDDVLVVHNGRRFDVPLLERLTAPCGGTKGLIFLDTLPLARNLLPGSLKLDDLAARFGVGHRPTHRALDDALCLAEVFERLQEERLRRGRKTCRADLLDCVALGAALENRRPGCPEDEAIVEAGRWRDLRRPPAVVDAYAEEVERFGLRCPPLDELIDRLDRWDEWRGARAERAPRDRYPESYQRLRRLLDLVRAGGSPDEAIQELLDRATLSASDGAGVDADRVSLLTFHATKGLEFSRVYLAGVEDNQVLGSYARSEGREDELREARRLLYVAMTRAKDRLTLTCCRERNGRPGGGTTFLDEMGLAAAEVPACGV
jgi:DNA polymerase III epsilon subunit family exonuclease